jgi:glycosyltransferase involved in cell wall biosynthesis
MIKNGKNGLIINPKKSEEIVTAVSKILTWKNKNITKYAERYRWKEIIKQTATDYKNIK